MKLVGIVCSIFLPRSFEMIIGCFHLFFLDLSLFLLILKF